MQVSPQPICRATFNIKKGCKEKVNSRLMKEENYGENTCSV